jgi:23S rRNA (cytidine1920-2'-O)/16S rRNA (cytidine1409-2'-O)-methyltransferase
MTSRRTAVPLARRLRQLQPGLADPEAVIAAGEVLVGGLAVTNPASMVRHGDAVVHRPPAGLRGEVKLRAALEHFAVSVRGRVALDVGASTGGFTKVLLEAGALRVYAVDAGHGQLLGSLRQDARVINLEATNVGALTPAHVPEPVQIATVDVSYLALSAAVEHLARIDIAPAAELVGLVKPMFELRRSSAPTDAGSLALALDAAVRGVAAAGWTVVGTMASPVTGRGGAPELVLHARWPDGPGRVQ